MHGTNRSRARNRRAPFLVLGAIALLAFGGALSNEPAKAHSVPSLGAVLQEKKDEEEEHGGDIVFYVQSRLQKHSVLFSHDAHLKVEGLKCEECHEKIFKQEFGVNRFRMMDVNKGRFCGTCHQVDPPEDVHGSFAPKKNCEKCHSLRVRPLLAKPSR